MRCPSTEKCPFFNDMMANMPAAVDLLKERYCLSDDHTTCARWRVKTALGTVPANLFPNQVAKAEQLIATKKAG
jgi:hypothetical protein